jgi:hypothetical protein
MKTWCETRRDGFFFRVAKIAEILNVYSTTGIQPQVPGFRKSLRFPEIAKTKKKNSSIVTGAFRDGFFHGPGVARRPNGGMMRGTWINSVAVGHFEDVSDKPGGGRYEGEFSDTSRQGQGTLYSASGYVYNGTFRYNEMHGEGTRMYKDGTIYNGSSARGSIHGYGKMIYASSAVYEGEWNNNRKHGKGLLTFPEGHVFTGVWANGLATNGIFEFAL